MTDPSRATEEIIDALDAAAMQLERALTAARHPWGYKQHASRIAELYNSLNDLYDDLTNEVGRKLRDSEPSR